jgi:hypothetical protein
MLGLVSGGELREHVIETLPARGKLDHSVAEAIEQRSRELSTPRAQVEAWSEERTGWQTPQTTYYEALAEEG